MNLEQLNTNIASYQLHRIHYEHDLEIIRILFENLSASATIDDVDSLVTDIDNLYIEIGRLNQDSNDGSFDKTSFEIARIERQLANNKIKEVPADFSKLFPEDTEEFNEYLSNLRPSQYISEDIDSIKMELIEIRKNQNPADFLFDTSDKDTEYLVQNAAKCWNFFIKRAINLCTIL